MKKSLLIAVAALFVALGANAQAKLVAKQSRQLTTQVTAEMTKKATMNSMVVKPEALKAAKPVAKNKIRKVEAADIAGVYILDEQNLNRDFTSSSEFSIETAEGSVKVGEFDETTEEYVETRDFEYNVKISDFAVEGSVAYGFFDSTDNTLWIPMQKIAEDNDPEDPFGRIVLSTISEGDGGSVNYGGDIVFEIDDAGNLIFASDSDGYCTFGPDELSEYFFWNYGFDIEVFFPNGVMISKEVHTLSGGGWGEWTTTDHYVNLENYETELVVHNFFNICPISITVSGNEYDIQLPVYLGTHEYPTYGKMQIWTDDENGTDEAPLTNEGSIKGYSFLSEDGYPGIRFWETEYRDEWTDAQGTHEAGNYYIYRPFFYLGAIDASGYGYWWGESYGLSIFDLTGEIIETGINAVKATTDTKSTTLYDLQGRVVDGSYKGIVISNGKKMVVK
jgi:hypothetical protein